MLVSGRVYVYKIPKRNPSFGTLWASKNRPRKLVSKPPFAAINFYGMVCYQVGGFNQSEKYKRNWIISPGRDESKTHLKPRPSYHMAFEPNANLRIMLKIDKN